jgi:hypothetical protein
MYKGWAFLALAPRPTVVYCALVDTCKGVDKILKTVRNSGIVLATLKELQLATLNVHLPFVYTL